MDALAIYLKQLVFNIRKLVNVAANENIQIARICKEDRIYIVGFNPIYSSLIMC